MVFDSNTNKTDEICSPTNNGLLENKNAIKYLGVFIDYKLFWKYHCKANIHCKKF